jgi:hypothetical protein
LRANLMVLLLEPLNRGVFIGESDTEGRLRQGAETDLDL